MPYDTLNHASEDAGLTLAVTDPHLDSRRVVYLTPTLVSLLHTLRRPVVSSQFGNRELLSVEVAAWVDWHEEASEQFHDDSAGLLRGRHGKSRPHTCKMTIDVGEDGFAVAAKVVGAEFETPFIWWDELRRATGA